MRSRVMSGLNVLFDHNGWAGVLTAREHGFAITRARSALIDKRVRFIGLLFAALTVVWIAMDAATFERQLWVPLALGRLVAALAFVAIAMHEQRPFGPRATFAWLTALFAVPACYFVYSHVIFASTPGLTMPVMMTVAYAHMPFIVMTGLAIFPLTLGENVALGALLLVLFAAGIVICAGPQSLPPRGGLVSNVASNGREALSMLWPLFLVTCVAAIAGMSQLQFLAAATEQSSRDGLTGVRTRHFGEQILEFQFEVAKRSGAALSVIFVDLDAFKCVNDRYGHDCGDKVLNTAAQALVSTLRQQDVVVRWGGEEFLVLMPYTNIDEALSLVARVAKAGLGLRPDGMPQTASLGLAERTKDSAPTWLELIDIADGRMYAAKAAGKNMVVSVDAVARPFIEELAPEQGDRSRKAVEVQALVQVA